MKKSCQTSNLFNRWDKQTIKGKVKKVSKYVFCVYPTLTLWWVGQLYNSIYVSAFTGARSRSKGQGEKTCKVLTTFFVIELFSNKQKNVLSSYKVCASILSVLKDISSR